MKQRTIWMIFVTVVTVLAWSVVMAAFGQAAAVMTLAPALGVLVQQIVAAARPQAVQARAARAHRPPSQPPEAEEGREQ